jgi:hypothetical protein
LVYAIENNTGETDYKISFRIAAESSGSRFDFYVGDVRAGQFYVPSTGGWQIWRSVVKDIVIPEGKHYLKFLTVSGGFNINYFEIYKEVVSSLNGPVTDNVSVYPNPASNKIMIRSDGFQYNKVEIINTMGTTVMSRSIVYEPELHLPVSLTNGIYILKLSNGKDYHLKNIVINND